MRIPPTRASSPSPKKHTLTPQRYFPPYFPIIKQSIAGALSKISQICT